MAETTEFELVSPERLVMSASVEMVVIPGSEGDFGALPRHAPMITAVRPGIIDVYRDGKVSDRIFVAGGFVEVTETRVTMLAEEAFAVDDLVAEMVDKRVTDAEEAVQEADSDAARHLAERGLAVAHAMRDALAGRKGH